jgi:glycosyltransferase involved in cell wall biosynthesis
MEAFARFSRKVGPDRVALLMHTAANDQEGQDIHAVSRDLGIEKNLLLSEGRVPPEQLNLMYNCADCVINISSNEGFGLGTLEALYAGVPIVVNMTGGLQFQIGDWWCDQEDFSDQDHLTRLARNRKNSHRWWGVPVYPAARNRVGSQQVPYIYDDRVNDQQVADALEKVFRMGRKERRALGLRAREWAIETFGMKRMIDGWDEGLTKAMKRYDDLRGNIGATRFAVI